MNYLQSYSSFLKKFLKVQRPLKVVCDASNGIAGMVVRAVFGNHPKIKLILINGKPNGNFPAHGPNPLADSALNQCVEKVKKEKADLGAVFDADGDRVFFIDETGRPLPSFLTSILLFESSKPPFVADELVFQSLRLMKAFPPKELKPSKVGSYYVKTEMKKHKAGVAGEYSGHFYFKDFFGADSGMMALIKVLNLLSKSDNTLLAQIKNLPEFFIEMKNQKFQGNFSDLQNQLEKRFSKSAVKIEKRDGLSVIFKDSFLNIRASNTEPLIRLTAGAKTKKYCYKLLALLKG